MQHSRARRWGALAYGLLCHGTFAWAVVAMVAVMYGGMQQGRGSLTGPWGWVANGGLLALFVGSHSLLLTGRGRRLLSRLVPGRCGSELCTTTYALLASLLLLALFVLWSPSGTVWWRATGWGRRGLTVLYGTSWLLVVKALLDAGLSLQTGYLGWSAVVAGRPPRYPPMPVSGLFRFCRQPIYLAFAATTWTVPVWTPDQLMVAVVLTLYCLLGPLHKERRFLRLHGEAFRRYQQRVPYWLPLNPGRHKEKAR